MNKRLKAQIAGFAQDVPRRLARRMVRKKLEQQQIENEELLEALTDHILHHSDETFTLPGEFGDDRDVTITFSDEDFDALIVEMDDVIRVDLPNALTEAISSASTSVVKQWEKQWPEVKLKERHENNAFKDRLDLRWASALDPLRMMFMASREIGEAFAQKLGRSKAKKGLMKRQVLMMLHVRACQTTLEIITLLESGLADGAYARWRTLYELSVVCFLVARFGDELAKRYLAHEIVSQRESLINEMRHAGRPYEPEKMGRQIMAFEADYLAAIDTYGLPFKTPYGWAAHSLSLKAPRFADLEEAVDWTSLPADYKWSSYKVHAGIVGTVWSLGTLGDNRFIFAGATNAGLEVPAVNTAFSLLHVTSVLLESGNDMDLTVQAKALIVLRDKVLNNSRKIANKLRRDHNAIFGAND